MEQKVNIRRLRLKQAVNLAEEQYQLNRIPSNSEVYNIKLKILEIWEGTKRKAVERLTDETEKLVELESKIEQRERALESSGIHVDKVMFGGQENSGVLADISVPNNIQKLPFTSIKTLQVKATSLQDLQKPKRKLRFYDSISDAYIIGPNGTTIPKESLYNMNWALSGAALTRKILVEVFDRDTLATHTLTGKPSPAFMDCVKPAKQQLDPAKVADIIYMATTNFNMSVREARAAITTKCADENKMARQRASKNGGQSC